MSIEDARKTSRLPQKSNHDKASHPGDEHPSPVVNQELKHNHRLLQPQWYNGLIVAVRTQLFFLSPLKHNHNIILLLLWLKS